MNKAMLCLGSNVPESHDKLKEGMESLKQRGCAVVRCTPVYTSYSGYQNQLLEVETELGYQELWRRTKQIEVLLGRSLYVKSAGIVPIDIDIVVWNGEVVRQADFDAQYFKQGLGLLGE